MSDARRRLLAKVHVAKKQLGLDDETYRDVLERVTGKRSAGELDDSELLRVLDDLKRRGWTAAESSPARRSKKPHVRKVWAVWGEMCRAGIVSGRQGLRSFVTRMTGLTDPEWLTSEQATKVIEGLKAWQARVAKDVATCEPDKITKVHPGGPQ